MAPTGALEEVMLSVRVSVRHFPQNNTANEFLKHSKGSRGVLGQAGKQAGKQVGKQAGKQASKQASRQASRQSSKQASKQAGKKTGKKVGKH